MGRAKKAAKGQPTADVVAIVPARPGPSVQNYATPQYIVDAYAAELGGAFDLDVAAEPGNAKAPLFYALPKNGLVERWDRFVGDDGADHLIERAWDNPPYEDQGLWVARSIFWADQGVTTVNLVQASIGSHWFHNYVRPACMVDVFVGRIAFIDPATGEPKKGSSFDSIACIAKPGRVGAGVMRFRDAETGRLLHGEMRIADLFSAVTS